MEKLDHREFDQIFALMKLSFAKDELRTYEEQKSLLGLPNYEIFVEKDRKLLTTKAFIAIWHFKTFLFVDYFAVHPAYRNQKLGEHMLNQLFSMSQKDICLEIETPVNTITQRRLHFYERNHFHLCKLPYQQPPISRGNAPVELSLMSTKQIDDPLEFEHIKSDIYQYAYLPFI